MNPESTFRPSPLARSEPKVTLLELVIHRADGTVQRIEFHGSEYNRVTVELAARPVDPVTLRRLSDPEDDLADARWISQVTAEVKVVGRDKLMTYHVPESVNGGQ